VLAVFPALAAVAAIEPVHVPPHGPPAEANASPRLALAR